MELQARHREQRTRYPLEDPQPPGALSDASVDARPVLARWGILAARGSSLWLAYHPASPKESNRTRGAHLAPIVAKEQSPLTASPCRALDPGAGRCDHYWPGLRVDGSNDRRSRKHHYW